MTYGKGLAIALGFFGAVALGIGIGPYVVDHPAVTSTGPAAVSLQSEETSRESKPAGQAVVATRSDARVREVSIATSSPELHARLQPLFVFGGKPDMMRVSTGFQDAEQFAAVAHAARNTGIPFALLRHRVVSEGKDLATAIRELKPDANARIEANLAIAEARADIAALGD